MKFKDKLWHYKYTFLNTIGHSIIDFGFWVREKAID